MRRLLLFCLFAAVCLPNLFGQITRIFSPDVKTLRLQVEDGVAESLPVISLAENEKLHVSFDCLDREYHRFTYRIEHLDRNFRPEEGLFEGDYVSMATDEPVIDDYVPSEGTSMLFTHYSFSLPNEDVQPLLSGNYRLIVEAEDESGEKRPVAEAFFYVAERLVGMRSQLTTDTEIDRDARHHQLSLSLNYEALSPRDASGEVHIAVLQNSDWNTAVLWPKPTADTGRELLWQHCSALIFPAGNEFRKFEIPSTRYPGMHVERVAYFAPYYHAELRLDERRKNFLYDEDQNGRSVILSDDGSNPDIGADYLLTHFSLQADSSSKWGDVYVDGEWTYHLRADQYQMQYDAVNNKYELVLPLKQGYYSYRYICTDAEGKPLRFQPVEGDFSQTENEYTVLVYYRKAGARYDRLVGFTKRRNYKK